MPLHTAVLIGRFQPPHHGHLALLRQALQQAEQVVVVLGSAHQARSPKNPFTWEEREALLRACLPAGDAARLHCVPVRDYYDEPRWVQAVTVAVQALVPNDAQARVGLIAHFKDASSSYLARFPGWELLSLPRQGDFDATPVRDILWNLEGLAPDQVQAQLAPLVPAPVLHFLRQWMDTPAYGELQAEWRMLCGYRAAWASAPYPPVFVTVDALLRCQGHVLLIRRGHAPGRGLWALPGGFLEPRDSLWQSCVRELHEETALPLQEPALRAALRGVQVFDHPDRSLRGRTLTHAHWLDLGAQPLPPVHAGDDAALAQWVPVDQLAALETQFFEDHYRIVCQGLAALDTAQPA